SYSCTLVPPPASTQSQPTLSAISRFAQNPNLGQRNEPPSQAAQPPAQSSPLPRAAIPQAAPAQQRNAPPSQAVVPPASPSNPAVPAPQSNKTGIDQE